MTAGGSGLWLQIIQSQDVQFRDAPQLLVAREERVTTGAQRRRDLYGVRRPKIIADAQVGDSRRIGFEQRPQFEERRGGEKSW